MNDSTVTDRSPTGHSHPGVFARGLAMGMAEAVPGVSGGTIAFVTGIYDELITSIASFSHTSASTLLRDGWLAFARRHNLGFLAVLGAGMAVGLPLTLVLVVGLLDSHGVYVTGFFFGLIAAAVVHVGLQSSWRWLASLGLVGAGAGLLLGAVVGASAGQQTSMIFLAGALAATAWILPGLSGAFVLVVLGLYEPMANALLAVDLPVLAIFAAGLGIGVVCFSKLLAWLLERARPALLALLTGLMAGSLAQLWPWRETASSETVVVGVVAAMAAGALLVGVLGFASARQDG
ncbi:MAG: DUF368 domain-containing protein [Gammaproteobacteria bacterium]|nr:DUF368 domain-containing protein [Gammaproteobacteria bacterium]MDE0443918.1 DUF368 domain-containing protein [Gammaproteobacteria bacterium]